MKREGNEGEGRLTTGLSRWSRRGLEGAASGLAGRYADNEVQEKE